MVHRRPKAFTLIEVLVAIAIVSVLGALVLAALSQSRQKARQSVCVSNLHQLGMSIGTYLQDNDDRFPSFYAWDNWKKQHPQQQGCPLVHLTPQERIRVQGVPGYAFNAGLASGASIVHSAEVIYPALTVYACDEAPSVDATISPDPFILISPYPYGQEEGWKRHNGGGNYLFGDGHVKWYLPEGVDACNGVVGSTGLRPTFCYAGPHPFRAL